FSSRRRHTRSYGDWSSDVCSSDLQYVAEPKGEKREFGENAKRTPRGNPRHADQNHPDNQDQHGFIITQPAPVELLVRLVASGHPSTPGFNDLACPIEGRSARTAG